MLRLCLNGSALASRRITEAGAIALNQITLDQNLVGENPNPSAVGADTIAILTGCWPASGTMVLMLQ